MKNVLGNSAAKEELKTRGGEMKVPCLIGDEEVIYGAEGIIDWLKTHPDPEYPAPSRG